MELLPTPLRQTAQGYFPKSLKRSKPMTEIENLGFFMLNDKIRKYKKQNQQKKTYPEIVLLSIKELKFLTPTRCIQMFVIEFKR